MAGKQIRRLGVLALVVIAAVITSAAQSSIHIQCPTSTPTHPNGVGIKCAHVGGGDGFTTMVDRQAPMYIFGFSNLRGRNSLLPPVADAASFTGSGFNPITRQTDPGAVIQDGTLAAEWPAPTLYVDEGDELFLNLSNVGMLMRPDLFDPHSIHFHGLPNSAATFDGLPESGTVINMGATFTYYYRPMDPGTYIWHCHVEAAEHMQMGMLGTIYVRPQQNKTGAGIWPVAKLGGNANPAAPLGYAYNDGDGSTRYDVEYPIQVGAFDANFHDLHINVQPLPFAAMRDTYWFINGRGYPDNVNPNPIPTVLPDGSVNLSQKAHSIIQATAGQRILLRVSNVSVQQFTSLGTIGIPMLVVGKDAKLLRDTATPANNLYYQTNSLTIGGGELFDVILDTTGVAPGTYFLYSTQLDQLVNDKDNFGGAMTEIRIN